MPSRFDPETDPETGPQLRVLLFSTVFPNAAQPHHGTFVRDRHTTAGQVTQPAMHQFRTPAAGPERQIVLLDQHRPQSSCRRTSPYAEGSSTGISASVARAPVRSCCSS